MRTEGVATAGKHGLALAFLLAVAAATTIPQALNLPGGADDVNWAKRSLEPWWFSRPSSEKSEWSSEVRRLYYHCVDHPTLARVVYRAALHAAGVRRLDIEDWDYNALAGENIAKGRVLPSEVRKLLRCVNIAFFLAAVIVLYAAMFMTVRAVVPAVAGVLAIVLDPCIAGNINGLVVYIGADSVLFFLLAVSWLATLNLGSRPGSAILLGVVGGLAASAKINGAFVLAGAAVWTALAQRGWRRLVSPALLLFSGCAVFLAMNPVFLCGGPSWGMDVLRDIVRVRLYIRGEQVALEWGKFTRWEVIFASLPYLYFAVPACLVIVSSRDRRWFAPTVLWSLSIIVPNLALLYLFTPRYAAPVRMAFMALFMSAALTMVGEVWRGRHGATTQSSAHTGLMPRAEAPDA